MQLTAGLLLSILESNYHPDVIVLGHPPFACSCFAPRRGPPQAKWYVERTREAEDKEEKDQDKDEDDDDNDDEPVVGCIRRRCHDSRSCSSEVGHVMYDGGPGAFGRKWSKTGCLLQRLGIRRESVLWSLCEGFCLCCNTLRPWLPESGTCSDVNCLDAVWSRHSGAEFRTIRVRGVKNALTPPGNC